MTETFSGQHGEEGAYLQELLKQQHLSLVRCGLAGAMMLQAQRLYETRRSPWSPGTVGDSKFMLTTGSSEHWHRSNIKGDPVWADWGLYIRKAESDAVCDQVDVRVCSVEKDYNTQAQVLKVSEGFTHEDACRTYVLARQLIVARDAGWLSLLARDLHSIAQKPMRVLPFSIDESLFGADHLEQAAADLELW